MVLILYPSPPPPFTHTHIGFMPVEWNGDTLTCIICCIIAGLLCNCSIAYEQTWDSSNTAVKGPQCVLLWELHVS